MDHILNPLVSIYSSREEGLFFLTRTEHHVDFLKHRHILKDYFHSLKQSMVFNQKSKHLDEKEDKSHL